jgi:hypothetical protein
MSMRASRTWTIGGHGEAAAGGMGGMMGGPGGGGPPPGGGGMGGGGPRGGGGGPPGGGMIAPPPGMMGGQGAQQATSRRYTITLSLNASNVLNHVNWAAPNGDLSSPFFGEHLSLASGFGPPGGGGGGATYNRKVDVQLRFAF